MLNFDDPKSSGINGQELRGQLVFGKWDPEQRQIALAERTESDPLQVLITHYRGGKVEGEKFQMVFNGLNPSKLHISQVKGKSQKTVQSFLKLFQRSLPRAVGLKSRRNQKTLNGLG